MTGTPISLEANTVFRATWSGTLPNAEIFAHHQMFYSPDGTATPASISGNLSTHITNLLSTVTTGVNTMKGVFASTTAWTRLTVQEWDCLTDKGVGDPHYTALTDVGNGGQGLPNQLAHCVTIKSDPFGRTQMNRFYLPPYTGNVGGQVSGIVAADTCNAIANWLHNQQATLIVTVPYLSMCVYSPQNKAVYKPIETYVGNVLDTIRRRRNNIPEVRNIKTLAQLAGS